MAYVSTTIALSSAFVAISALGLIGALIMLLFVKETLVKQTGITGKR